MDSQELLPQMEQGLRAMGLVPEELPCSQYLHYLELLNKWNKAYNLSGIRNPEKMLSHHLFDSLSVQPFIQGEHCLDVGTGAGLPGLILALAMPQTHWVLLDSNHKKVRFLNQVVLELKPGNIEIVSARAEEFQPEQQFSTVIARAVTSLLNFRKMCRHLKSEDGVLLAMKGMTPVAELAELEQDNLDIETRNIQVAGLNEQRHLIIMR